jgi:hypothetical protein
MLYISKEFLQLSRCRNKTNGIDNIEKPRIRAPHEIMKVASCPPIGNKKAENNNINPNELLHARKHSIAFRTFIIINLVEAVP